MSLRILDQIGVAAGIIFHNVPNVTDEEAWPGGGGNRRTPRTSG